MTAMQRPSVRTLGIVAVSLAALPIAFVRAQSGSGIDTASPTVNTTMAAALSGKAFPLTLPMKDLGGSAWRRITLRDSAVPRGIEITPQVQLYRYYTQGQTLGIGGETFLVAYHRKLPEVKDMDKAAQLLLQGSDKPMPDTIFTLALLNLRTIAGLDDVQAVDLSQEMTDEVDTGRAKAAAQNVASLSNLKQMGLGLIQYSQDYDETFPPMKTPQAAKKALLPYIKNEEIFRSPITGNPYLPNPSLSEKSLSTLSSPASTVGFYEDAPSSDGTRAAAFADGHAKRFSEKEWPGITRSSGIKLP